MRSEMASRQPLPMPGPRFNYINLLLLLAVVGAFVISARATDFSPLALADASNQKATSNFIAGLFPPDLSAGFLKTTWTLTLETIAIAIVGTILAIVLAWPLALMAMRSRGEEVSRGAQGTLTWGLRWLRYQAARLVLNALRAVPELVWALIFVVMVGLGPFPGVLALAAHSTGVLGKLYSEIFESVDQRVVESARSTGANELQVTALARLPLTLPVVLSYTLFRWECNMRAATVLGFVGAGGLGTQLVISMKLFQYNQVLTLIGVLLILVFLVDIVGQVIRMRVLDASAGCSTRVPRSGPVQRVARLFGLTEK